MQSIPTQIERYLRPPEITQHTPIKPKDVHPRSVQEDLLSKEIPMPPPWAEVNQFPPKIPEIYKREYGNTPAAFIPTEITSTDPKFGFRVKYKLLDKNYNEIGQFINKRDMYDTVVETMFPSKYSYYDIDMPNIIHKMDFIKYQQQMFGE